jgi:hypothetical protein
MPLACPSHRKTLVKALQSLLLLLTPMNADVLPLRRFTVGRPGW